VLADETTTYERISDTGQNTTDITFDYGGSSWNRLDIHSGDCGSSSQAVHYNMQNNDDQTITITFPEDNVTTAGFLSGCVNDAYPVTWTFSDSTTETVNYSAQSNADVSTMYEVVSKTVTGKYITSVAIQYDDYVIVDDIYWTFGTTPTTTTTSTTTTSSTTTTTTTVPPTTTTTTTTTVPPTTTTSTTTTSTTTTTTLDPLTVQRNNNQAETGIYETDQERKDREDKEYQEWLAREEAKRQAEYEAEQERIRQEEEAERQRKEEERIAAELEAQRLYEEEQERLRLEEEARVQAELEAEQARIKAEQEELARLEAEAEAEIQKELEQSILKDVDVEELSEDELVEVKELIDTIQLLEETIDFKDYEIEEEVIEIDIVIEDIVVPTTTTTTTLAPIKEDFADEENDLPKDDLDTLPSEEREQEILPELTEEEVIEQVEVAQEVIEEVVNVEEIVEIKTDDELETLTDQEKEVYEEEVKAAIVEAVQELETDELVEVVEQVAQVSVQNLAVADEQTKQVVQAVVNEVTNVETIAELNEEEKQVVAEVLGVTETNDVQIIAEQSAKDENINIAVQEYVDRATENADVEDYSISNVIVEVQVEQFFADPIGQFTDIDLSDIVISDIGSDMTQSSKDNAKKTVVPVIIVGQIIATPIRRRF
jgi:hypothetical protein